MIVVLEERAKKQLYDLAAIIDDLNISGAGERWLIKFFQNVRDYAKPRVSYALCRNTTLASKGYSCITYNGKWVIAFKLNSEELRIYEVLHGALLD